MSVASLTISQLHYVNRAYWRNPALAFFAVVYPLIFLVIFTSIFHNSNVAYGGVRVNEATYYVPGIATLALITVCFNNVAVAITVQRDTGVLRRLAGTPLPRAAFFGARLLHAVLVAVLVVLITVTFGHVLYNIALPTGVTLIETLVALAVAAATFCALGFAMTAVIPNADASTPIVNAVVLPLLFVSGVFIPLGSNPPVWMLWMGRIFPIQHS